MKHLAIYDPVLPGAIKYVCNIVSLIFVFGVERRSVSQSHVAVLKVEFSK
jgi:hypothetical protein